MILSNTLEIVTQDEVMIHQTIFIVSLVLLVLCLFILFLLLCKKQSCALPLGRMSLRLILCFFGLAIFTLPSVTESEYRSKSNEVIEQSLDFIETIKSPQTTSNKPISSTAQTEKILVSEEMGFMIGKFACLCLSAVFAFLALLTFPFVRKTIALALALGCFFIILAPVFLFFFTLIAGAFFLWLNVALLLVLYLCTVLWILSKIPLLFDDSPSIPCPTPKLTPAPAPIPCPIPKPNPSPKSKDTDNNESPIPPIPPKKKKNKDDSQTDILRYPILIGSLGQKKITLPTSIGRRELSHICEDASFVSSPQYNLVQDLKNRKKWFVLPHKNVLNPTFLNGSLLREQKILQQGDILSVKDLNTEEAQAEVLVRFESKTVLSSKK